MINELATDAHFILLQEHWLYNYELPLLNSLHANFSAAGIAWMMMIPSHPYRNQKVMGV